MSQASPKLKSKHLREPPPSLFLGPPSQNASHVSLSNTISPPVPPPTSRAPLIRQSSLRMARTLDGTSPSVPEPTSVPRTLPRQHQDPEGKKQADRTDALWAEMQSTLEEVELSAVNGTHVFGPRHAQALEELRATQIGLAQAWARSEADEAGETGGSGAKGLALGSEGRSALDTVGMVELEGGPGVVVGLGGAAAAGERMGSKLEQETEADILLARRRREANDRYFQKVNGGVLDVVAKLEEVASAMRAVEQESRDIWGENESAATSIRG
ncbi:hypothetical protein LOCC1_G003580 [Lachnellula occidentalis]|uniref:Uncharacterized protein n=1 Tax=Lachnellula occidentalis TaxID=215460 RepID=A0A8H8UI51_9HELO|nr:hypothetical protein LOCC1_G003580 [Lachnellula occidentalis]